MQASEIRDYLGDVMELEKECYTQEQLRSNLKRRISSLGLSKHISPPKKIKRGFLDYFDIVREIFTAGIGGAGLGAIIGGIISIFTSISFVNGIIWGAICAGALLFLFGIAENVMELVDEKREYVKKIDEYQQALEEDKHRVQKENVIIEYLKQECSEVNDCYKSTCNTLSKLYSLDILFPKYRTFAAVSTLYEYFCSRRFNTLEDAYNQLELEVRLDRITLRMDTIIAQLDNIKDTQYMIYNAISQANTKLNTLIKSSNRMESRVQQLQVQGAELSSQIAGLQTTSDLTLYVNALNNRELTLMRRWVTE